jgi:mono/diheme cytochrome c family protein
MKPHLLPTLLGIALLAAVVLFFLWLWSVTASLDSYATGDNLTARLMERKFTVALEIRDHVAEGELREAEGETRELRKISETANWYLPEERYAGLSDDFRRALNRLDGALADRDPARARETYSQLAESCIVCHRQTAHSALDPDLVRLPAE